MVKRCMFTLFLFHCSGLDSSEAFAPGQYLFFSTLQRNNNYAFTAARITASPGPLISPVIAPFVTTPANPTQNSLTELTASSAAHSWSTPTVIALPVSTARTRQYSAEQIQAIVAAARKFFPMATAVKASEKEIVTNTRPAFGQ